MPLKLKYSLLVAFLIGCWYLHIHYQNKAVEAAKTVLIAEYEQKMLKAAKKALDKQNEMQDNADKTVKDKDEKIKAIDTQLTAALSELRKRPSRTQNNSKDTGDTKACTGRELFREDAEFLTREASRADRILTERDYYYQQYESVRRSMDETSN